MECLLKAYLIKQVNAQTLNEAVGIVNELRNHQGKEPLENIARSAAGHRLYYLLQVSNLVTYNAYDVKLWGRLSKWQSSWRYETDTADLSRGDADDFMVDVQAAVDWLLPLTS